MTNPAIAELTKTQENFSEWKLLLEITQPSLEVVQRIFKLRNGLVEFAKKYPGYLPEMDTWEILPVPQSFDEAGEPNPRLEE
jgi:hypothetical protein